MSDHTDDVGAAEGLEGPTSVVPRNPAAAAATAAAIEDARAVAGSLLGPWKRDRHDLWELQRPWPSLDPDLPQGALRHPSAPIPAHAAPQERENEAPRKRQRREPAAEDDSAQDVAAVKPDGSLELPTVHGVPPEVVAKVLEGGVRCGVCAGCTALPRHGRETACVVLKVAKQWKEALGGVTYAAVRDVASKIEVPRQDITYKGRVGYGVRCGLCPACTNKRKAACILPEAIVANTLPPRLRAAAVEGSSARDQRQGRISLQDYLAQMPGHARSQVDPAAEAEGGVRGGSGADRESDDDDDLRWASWGDYLARPPSAAQQDDSKRLKRQPKRRQRGGGGAGGSGKPTASEVARRQGVEPESLTEWVCRARVRSADLPTPQRVTRRQSAIGASQPALQDCGHANSRSAFSCESCGAPRWDGPLGQLRARVAAALQGGLLAGAAGLPAGEADAALAAAVAARMAAEAGTAPNALPDFQGGEERAPGGAGGDGSPEGTLQEIYTEIQAVRKTMEAAVAAADRPASEASGRSSSALAAAAAAARATQLAGAVMELEGAVCRLVEEQEGLAVVKRRQLDPAAEREGPGAVAEAETHPLRTLRSLRALLAEDRILPASRPGSAADSEERGGNGNGGAGASTAIGFSAFCARISACLSDSGAEGQVSAADGRHRATCELLYCCPPPPPARGWTETAMTQLETVLSEPQAMEVLKAASHAGGTPMAMRALHALLRLAERSIAAAAAAGAECGEFPASGGSQMQMSQQLMFLPTQQSQPDPGLPVAGSEAPAPALAAPPPPPADTNVAQYIAILDDLIGSYEFRGLQGPDPSRNAIDSDAHEPRLRRLAHASASTLSFLYGLTHSVLNTIALRQAENVLPVHLASTKTTILDHARFPELPPLPPPAFMPELTGCGDGADALYRPVPDSRRPAQAMAPEIAAPSGRGGRRPAPLPHSELRPGGAFAAWGGGREGTDAAHQEQPAVPGGAMAAAEAAVAMCPADAQLVFSEALKEGMRPEAVAAAAQRYVALTAAGEEEG